MKHVRALLKCEECGERFERRRPTGRAPRFCAECAYQRSRFSHREFDRVHDLLAESDFRERPHAMLDEAWVDPAGVLHLMAEHREAETEAGVSLALVRWGEQLSGGGADGVVPTEA